MVEGRERRGGISATRALRLGVAAAAAAWLGGCSSINLLNAVTPKGGVVVTRDVAFASGPRGGLDIYRPSAAVGSTSAAAPVVVFIYGGGWDSGRKADYAFVGAALARRGYVAMIPDYRIYPQVKWPTFLQDNAQAVRWAVDHASQYGGDAKKLVLMGHSAGAYAAAMLTLDKRWLAAVDLDPARDVKAMVGLAGPYDFLPLHSEELKIIFGPPAGRPATQPIAYVDGRNPPMFLAADLGDKVVEPENTTRLAARIRAAGGSVQTRYYKGLNHALLVGALAPPLRFLAPVFADSARFIDSVVGSPVVGSPGAAPAAAVSQRETN